VISHDPPVGIFSNATIHFDASSEAVIDPIEIQAINSS
jgi:hypothetical protein